MSIPLEAIARCFHGIIPASIATCDLEGEPNVTYLSHVHQVDEQHVALSCQFFNKTKRNVLDNPLATIVLHDPVTFEAWRLHVRYLHAESEGPLFELMSARIDVIASHTGMAGVFKLISADVYRVLSVEAIEDALLPAHPQLDSAPEEPPTSGHLTELRGVQVVSNRIARAANVEEMVEGTLASLDDLLGFSHSMILVHDEAAGLLRAVASRGYGVEGAGAVVPLGAGLIGTVASQRRMICVAGVGAELRYGRAVRERVEQVDGRGQLREEIPLPGLADAQAQLALPLLVGERLVGVLAVESRDPLGFGAWDEAFLQIVANQIAAGVMRLEPSGTVGSPAAPLRRFVRYGSDDCIFLDDEYLVRNLPARILWTLLLAHQAGRQEFSNRELRLDPSLGLPPVRDNLESRLILLRKRLAEKCPEVSLPPTGRGRFAIEVDCRIALTERA